MLKQTVKARKPWQRHSFASTRLPCLLSCASKPRRERMRKISCWRSLLRCWSRSNLAGSLRKSNSCGSGESPGIKSSIVIDATRVFWQPHGKLLALIACADSDCASPDANSLLILDTTNWQTVNHYQNAANLSWSPDGKQLAIVSMGWQSVRIVDALSGAFVKQINAPAQTMIGNISWSPDASRLAGEATGGRLSTISIWSVTNGKVLYTFPGTASEGAWSPDGKYISCSMEVKSSAHGGNGEVAIWIA